MLGEGLQLTDTGNLAQGAAPCEPTCHQTAAPLGRRTVQVIWPRWLQPTGRFRRRSLSLVGSNMATIPISSWLPSMEQTRQDWRGWSVSIFSGIGAGILVGSGSSGLFHFDRLGPVFAGVAVALVTASLARNRLVVKTLLAGFVVTGSCLLTITLRHWSTGHWPVGHIDGKWPLIAIALVAYVCLPAMGVGLLVAAIRRKRAEPDGAANRSQPIRTETSRTSAAAGPDR
jgi:hypothetical protein